MTKRRVSVLSIIVIALVLMLAQTLAARESQPIGLALPSASSKASTVSNVQGLELVSQIGGEVDAVAVQGSYAYYGLGPRLVVLNISDPARSFLVGQTDVLSSTVKDISLVGNFVYAVGDAGLSIINIADPTHPAITGLAAAPIGTGYLAVAVVGHTAYLAAAGGTQSGLYLVDVTNPAAPSDLGHYFSSDVGYGVAVVGQYAYLADESGLRIINVSTPSAPTLAGAYAMTSTARAVAVSGSYAYVGDTPGVLSILNISTPGNVSQVGSFNPNAGTLFDIVLAADTAYLAAGSRLSIVNVANRSNPTELGHLSSRENHSTPALAIAGSYAYLAEGSGGLGIINVSAPTAPAEVGFWASAGSVFDVAAAGGYAYTVGWQDGLHIFNVSSAAAPGDVGGYHPSNAAMSVAVQGNTAYLGEAAGLRILNIASRSQPIQSGFLSIPANVPHLTVAGNYAYLANQDRGLRIVNVANPASPSEVGHFDTPGLAYEVAVSGTYAYVADGDQGLRIVNVASPSAPYETGAYTTTGYIDIEGVAIAGHYAYLAGGGNGLQIIDVANPAHPVEAGSRPVYGSANTVVVAGDYAYVTDNNLRIINIADPAHPYEVASFDTPGPATSLAVSGNYVYVATQRGGLVTMWFVPPATASVPVAGGSLASSPDNTAYTFPSGAFASTAIITHTPRFPGNVPVPPANQIGIDHVFEVTATTTSGQPAQLVSGKTYTLTVTYADGEKGPTIEDTLALFYWNGGQWVKEPSGTVSTSTNTIVAQPDHFSVWAVFGETHRIYLPLTMKN